MDSKYNSFVKSLEEDTAALKDGLTAQLPEFKQSVKAKLSSI
jgi:hypothetical protein